MGNTGTFPAPKTYQASFIKFVPDFLRAYLNSNHILSILDRLSTLGDRVTVTTPIKKMCFTFHPDDIAHVFRTNSKSLETAKLQRQMVGIRPNSGACVTNSSNGKVWRTLRKQ